MLIICKALFSAQEAPSLLSVARKKMIFSFAFCLFSRAFGHWPKVLSLRNEKKSVFFFCISLAYSYLCRQTNDRIDGNYQ